MRIIDWSSDVCSSDLAGKAPRLTACRKGCSACPERPSLFPARAGAAPQELRSPAHVEPDHETRASGGRPQDRWRCRCARYRRGGDRAEQLRRGAAGRRLVGERAGDRKSTRPELQSLMRISYAVFCLKKKKKR